MKTRLYDFGRGIARVLQSIANIYSTLAIDALKEWAADVHDFAFWVDVNTTTVCTPRRLTAVIQVICWISDSICHLVEQLRWIHQYLRAQIQAPGSVPIYWKICISDLGYIYWLQSPVSVQIVPQFNQSIQPYFLRFYLQQNTTPSCLYIRTAAASCI